MWKRVFLLCAFTYITLNGYAEFLTLKVDLQDSRPKSIKNSDGSFSGLTIECMSLIEKRSHYRFEIRKDFVPTKRIEKNLEAGITDLHFGFGKTPERENNFIFSRESLYELQFIMVSNSDDPVVVNTIQDIKNLGSRGVVLVILGTNTVDYFMNETGVLVDEGAKEIDANLDKLEAGRGRFFSYNNLALFYEMNLPRYKGKFKVQPIVLKKFDHYIMYSKSVPASVIDDLDRIIKELKRSKEWNKITEKYFSWTSKG